MLLGDFRQMIFRLRGLLIISLFYSYFGRHALQRTRSQLGARHSLLYSSIALISTRINVLLH